MSEAIRNSTSVKPPSRRVGSLSDRKAVALRAAVPWPLSLSGAAADAARRCLPLADDRGEVGTPLLLCAQVRDTHGEDTRVVGRAGGHDPAQRDAGCGRFVVVGDVASRLPPTETLAAVKSNFMSSSILFCASRVERADSRAPICACRVTASSPAIDTMPIVKMKVEIRISTSVKPPSRFGLRGRPRSPRGSGEQDTPARRYRDRSVLRNIPIAHHNRHRLHRRPRALPPRGAEFEGR